MLSSGRADPDSRPGTQDMKPRIAIPLPHGSDPEYAERAIPQYERAIELSGGEPVRIPLDHAPAAVMKLIERCDAVLLPGSKADVDPAKVGNQRRILVSELSGQASIATKTKKYGVAGDRAMTVKILQRVQTSLLFSALHRCLPPRSSSRLTMLHWRSQQRCRIRISRVRTFPRMRPRSARADGQKRQLSHATPALFRAQAS